jgi:cystathionine gamma-synthase
MKIDTECVHGCTDLESKTGAMSFPIYQTATFRHPGLNQSTGYDYSRTLNPTREKLEKTIALLEKGTGAFAFSTGMAAIAAVLELFNPHDHIVITDDLYGGTYRIIEEVYKKKGLEFTYTDTGTLENVVRSIQTNTRAIFIETPSNPMMKVSDLGALAALAQQNKLLLIVDNTFLTPYLQRPLELGADIVLHSGTKYLGGHNDTLCGLVVVKNPELGKKIGFLQNTIGAVLSPFDSWLILRGLKTLGIRLERQEKNAYLIANWLKGHEKIEKVYYAGLPDHPGYAVSRKQSAGFGAMLSFTVKETGLVERLLNNVSLIAYAESLGGVETLITYPVLQTHQAIPAEIRNKIGITDKLLRLSVGIENVADILDDLEKAMR